MKKTCSRNGRYKALVVTDSSNECLGEYVTQVSIAEVVLKLKIASLSHDTFGFGSGTFMSAQIQLLNVDKEAFTTVSTCRRHAYYYCFEKDFLLTATIEI